MNKFFLISLLPVLLICACSRGYRPAAGVTEVAGEAMLLGPIEYQDILHYFPEWQEHDREAVADPQQVQALQEVAQSLEIDCYLGTWCSDSREGVPPFMKALTSAGNGRLRVQLIGVDRQKDDPEHVALQEGIERVPTFVVKKNGKEIGRMIEYPLKSSFVEDFLDIIVAN